MKKQLPLLLCLLLLLSCTAREEETQSIESPSEKTQLSYSWIGQYSLQPGQYEVSIAGEGKTRIGLLKLGDHLHNLQESALELMGEEFHLSATKEIYPLSTSAVFLLDLQEQNGLKFNVREGGNYAIITQTLPKENKLTLSSSNNTEITPRHEHFAKSDSSEVVKCCAREHGEYKWMGSFQVDKGDYLLRYTGKEEIALALVKKDASPTSFSHEALHLMAKKKTLEGQLTPSEVAHLLPSGEHELSISLEKGRYLIILSHLPEEISFSLEQKDGGKSEPEETYIP